MRKSTVRNGMRLVMAALIMIIFASYYNLLLSDLLSLPLSAESRIYRLLMFWAAAIGGYGVVVTAIGFALSPRKNEPRVRLLPVFVAVSAMIFLFFYLLSSSINTPSRDEKRRVRPGDTITI